MNTNGFEVEVPPFVSGSFEALMASVFFDSSMNLTAVSNVRMSHA